VLLSPYSCLQFFSQLFGFRANYILIGKLIAPASQPNASSRRGAALIQNENLLDPGVSSLNSCGKMVLLEERKRLWIKLAV